MVVFVYVVGKLAWPASVIVFAASLTLLAVACVFLVQEIKKRFD
ncbi:MAG: hypothetical protein QW767_04035 [Thermoprotei archaeon]